SKDPGAPPPAAHTSLMRRVSAALLLACGAAVLTGCDLSGSSTKAKDEAPADAAATPVPPARFGYAGPPRDTAAAKAPSAALGPARPSESSAGAAGGFRFADAGGR